MAILAILAMRGTGWEARATDNAQQSTVQVFKDP